MDSVVRMKGENKGGKETRKRGREEEGNEGEGAGEKKLTVK